MTKRYTDPTGMIEFDEGSCGSTVEGALIVGADGGLTPEAVALGWREIVTPERGNQFDLARHYAADACSNCGISRREFAARGDEIATLRAVIGVE